ncbi:DUF6143 family protein [Clostridium rectalis]|uniref:DUF6143 family protein n=1 Tax=Clostridium rectalis TaxID=2040295 RepID=UPI000F62F007|nr:DUF6143 family protein [Clostridium rectalis]
MIEKCHTNITCINPIKVVNIENPVKKSFQGKYFLGQTRFLTFGDGCNAWGGLFNPKKSGVNLFVSTFAVTNASETPFLAQIWFNPLINHPGVTSKMVTPGNTVLCPLPKPKIRLAYNENTSENLCNGVNAFNRIVPAFSSIADDKNGKFIIPPGGSFVIFLPSIDEELRKGDIAFGWWEEKC